MIPATAHFIWFGNTFPWVYTLAIKSCLARGGFEKAVLHHDQDLSGLPWWNELTALAGFEARHLDPIAVLEGAPANGPALAALYRQLEAPASRANMVRAAILATEGGVYLDTDTITVASLEPLRHRCGVFFGEEHIVFPGVVRRSHRPNILATALARTGMREVCRRMAGGWQHFRHVESTYPLAANNAVMGASSGHPFVLDLLDRMLSLPRHLQLKRFALGTHLLQTAREENSLSDVEVQSPPVFYPVGPEISEHWFRAGSSARAGDLVRPETLVVHWYASVRTKAIIPLVDRTWVKNNSHRIAFAELALPFL